MADRLLDTAAVTAIVGDTTDGRAVFAGDGFPDVYPRVTLDAPQWIKGLASCGRSGELVFTIHIWAQGPDSSLVAGDLAAAVELALDEPLALAGWRVSSARFDGSRPVGDPSPGIEHFVLTYRLSVQRTA